MPSSIGRAAAAVGHSPLAPTPTFSLIAQRGQPSRLVGMQTLGRERPPVPRGVSHRDSRAGAPQGSGERRE